MEFGLGTDGFAIDGGNDRTGGRIMSFTEARGKYGDDFFHELGNRLNQLIRFVQFVSFTLRRN